MPGFGVPNKRKYTKISIGYIFIRRSKQPLKCPFAVSGGTSRGQSKGYIFGLEIHILWLNWMPNPVLCRL
jgi:hypothetical protein